MNNILSDLKVCDLSSKLPGPMASYLLGIQGAQVTKIENTLKPDSFSIYDDKNPQFFQWYQSLNRNKEILKISFKNDLNQLKKHLEQTDILFIPHKKYFKDLLDQLNIKPKVIIEIAGDKDGTPMHDLNALGLTHSFRFHYSKIDSPPYLPFAGVSFSQYMAMTALSLLRQAEKAKTCEHQIIYLSETAPLILDILNFDKNKEHDFLHNGKYPCYNIYKTKDHYPIFLAAIEDKFWTQFNQLFDLNLQLADRFSLNEEISNQIRKKFAKLTSNEVKMLIKDKSICLTVGNIKDK